MKYCFFFSSVISPNFPSPSLLDACSKSGQRSFQYHRLFFAAEETEVTEKAHRIYLKHARAGAQRRRLFFASLVGCGAVCDLSSRLGCSLEDRDFGQKFIVEFYSLILHFEFPLAWSKSECSRYTLLLVEEFNFYDRPLDTYECLCLKCS